MPSRSPTRPSSLRCMRLEKHRDLLNALWTLLPEKKVLEGEALNGFSATVAGGEPAKTGAA